MDPNTQQPAADTGADTSQTQEQIDDWSGAEADFLADRGVKTEEKGKPDEQTKSEKTPEEIAAEAANPDGKKPDEKPGAGDDSKKGDGTEEKTDPNKDPNLEQQADEGAPQREARAIQRELEADNQAMRADVKKELFPDFTEDILDDQGKAMKTPRDVMNHINPNTGKRFTEEEATAWLFAAQKHKDAERAEMTEKVERVSDVMIRQRDEADVIKGKYGKLLAELPELRKEIWLDYKATLVIDKQTGLIVDAPVSLQKFFERALKPYADYAAQLQANADATLKKQQQPTQTDAERKQQQEDRGDITSGGQGSVQDPEEKGWADAAKQYYEGK